MATLGEHLASTVGAGLTWKLPVPNVEFGKPLDPQLEGDLVRLEQQFQQSFLLVDSASGAVLRPASDSLAFDLDRQLPLIHAVARHRRPEIVLDEPPLATLAVPLPTDDEAEPVPVAVATFVTDALSGEMRLRPAAQRLGADPAKAWQWANEQSIWPPHALQRLAEAFVENRTARQQIVQLEGQFADVSSQLLNTFEEIALLHRLTQHLSLTGDVHELVELAAMWLTDVVPAEFIAIRLKQNPEQNAGDETQEASFRYFMYGDCPLSETQLDALIGELGPAIYHEAKVLNHLEEPDAQWNYPQVRELVCVPIREGNQFFGWILALNHTGRRTKSTCEDTFGTVEASLMASVAVILGIHSGNLELYRQQADFFASVVRAMISAIDAKDPYTCGHSERVAHISVCLARQLGCSQEELNTIYLSGLLHDIGKIGIETNVLRKADRLTEQEYEHVKQHPHLGYQILHGVKQLDKVLPVVLHHHEAWDGSGYPHGLQGDECPRLARIAAVADAIDAMSSDRPYRQGMPESQLDDILRRGAGIQWDPEVIDAFFRVRDQIRTICQLNRDERSLDVAQWGD